MNLDDLLNTIHRLRQERVNGGGDDVAADLHGYRMQLLRRLYARPPWSCALCAGTGTACRYDPAICGACDAALFQAGRRRCRKCGGEKALAGSFERTPEGTYRRICGACRARRSRGANRSAHLATRRARYSARRTELNAYARAWRAAHPGANRAHMAAYRKRHGERIRARNRAAYRRADRARRRAYLDSRAPHISALQRLRRARKRAAMGTHNETY